MKHIYFVRHGESEANVHGLVQGLDDPLSERGHIQAALLAERFREVSLDAFFASDAVRAQQTAAAIGQVVTLPLQTSEMFREVKRPSSFIKQHHSTEEYQAFLVAWREHFEDVHWRYEDEENFADVEARARQVFTFLEAHDAQNILVVTHGHFLRFLMSSLLLKGNITPALWRSMAHTLWINNTGITLCTFDPEKKGLWQMLTWNDHAHFAE